MNLTMTVEFRTPGLYLYFWRHRTLLKMLTGLFFTFYGWNFLDYFCFKANLGERCFHKKRSRCSKFYSAFPRDLPVKSIREISALSPGVVYHFIFCANTDKIVSLFLKSRCFQTRVFFPYGRIVTASYIPKEELVILTTGG